MKIKRLGIEKKVLLGSVVIGLVLFITGLLAYFEFGRMSKYVYTLIADNIASVNTSRYLMNISEEYNANIMQKIASDQIYSSPEFPVDEKFLYYLDELETHFTSDKEKCMADSIRYSYIAYMHVVQEVDEIWLNDYSKRNDWYFDRLGVVYEKLKGYIQKLTIISQEALADNYYNLNDSFYRSITPIIVSMSAGIILVVLFNYFINLFVLSPLIKINKGLDKYKNYNKSYDVGFDYGGDQMQELNQNIKDIVEENRSLKKK
jgi:methyl-accepting chemotaxis protein